VRNDLDEHPRRGVGSETLLPYELATHGSVVGHPKGSSKPYSEPDNSRASGPDEAWSSVTVCVAAVEDPNVVAPEDTPPSARVTMKPTQVATV
jgi:hypothetical protein